VTSIEKNGSYWSRSYQLIRQIRYIRSVCVFSAFSLRFHLLFNNTDAAHGIIHAPRLFVGAFL
jgi:hypothetical protein